MRSLIFVLLFLLSNFQAQVRKFNFQKFEKDLNLRENKSAKIINKDYRWKNTTYEDHNGNIIKLSQQGDGNYREEIKKKNSVYRTISIYYEDTHTLGYEGTYFQDIRVGIEKNYFKAGDLINEKDNNKIFRDMEILTTEDMVKIMKKKFNIDITKEDELYLLSYFEKEGKYICQIVCKPHPKRGDNVYYSYLFDAKTGAFLNGEIFTVKG